MARSRQPLFRIRKFGVTESAIERQVAKSLPQGLLALRKAIRGSTTYRSIYSLSKLYFCFLECVLWYPLSHTLEPWYVTVHSCLLMPALKPRNRYPASRKWYASISNVGAQIRQADCFPVPDQGLHEVPGHCDNIFLWLSDHLHHACARRLHAWPSFMDHAKRMSPNPSLAKSKLIIQQVFAWVRLERVNIFDPMANQGMKFYVDRLVSVHCSTILSGRLRHLQRLQRSQGSTGD